MPVLPPDRDVFIAPSILSADTAYLARDLDHIKNADLIHFDVMDGHFTANLTFGPDILKAVKRVSSVPVDVHMMVTNPDQTIDWYADAGADIITVHWEASTHLHRTLHHLRERGVLAGVVLNPATPVNVLESIVEDVDIVLVMSVNPGFGGQAFIPSTLRKVRDLSRLCASRGVSPLIEVDGGVTADNAAAIAEAGANVLVAGSAVFRAANPAIAVDVLREHAQAGFERRRNR